MLILASTLIALTIGAVWALRQPPAYRAEGLLQLERRGGSGLGLPSAMQELISTGKPTALGEAEMAILRSRLVLRRAALETGLDVSAASRALPVLGSLPARLGLKDPGFAALKPFAWGNETLRLATLELPEALLDRELRLTISAPQSYELALPGGEILHGHAGTPLSRPDQGISVLITQLDGPIGRQFTLIRHHPDTAMQLASDAFSVSETPRNSALLRLSYIAPSPQRAEEILAAIIGAYVAQNIQRGAAEAQNSLDFIEEQLPLAETEMSRAQAALNRYRQDQNSVDVDYETQNLLEQATTTEAELNALALQEDELKKRYTPNHPTYQSLLETRAALQTRLERLRTQTADLPQTQREIFNLTRALEVAQQVYLQLLNRAQELRVLRASTVGSVHIVDPAWSSGLNINISLLRSLGLALMGGLLGGAALALSVRLLPLGIRGANEIEKIGMPVLVTIPHSAAAQQKTRRGTLAILAQAHPDDLAIEALRSLRTALHFGLLHCANRCVLLTSAAPDVGKSFTAINLAFIAAQAGQNVCLIDADLRRGYLGRYLDRPRETLGLADLLAGKTTLSEALISGPVPGLSVILSGPYPPNPSELMMRPSLTELLDKLNGCFDLVIIDSPPVLAVTDAVILGRQVGTVLVLARHLETQPAQITALRRSLQTAGVGVTGAVLNAYRPEHGQNPVNYAGAYSYRYAAKSRQG